MIGRFLEDMANGSAQVRNPVPLPPMKTVWVVGLASGVAFWIVGLALWSQGTVDEAALFFFDAERRTMTPLVTVFHFWSGYGMPAITALYVLYLLASFRIPRLDAPKTLYLYVLFSFGLSGIAGDLLKMVFARPRPVAVLGDRIVVFSSATSQALPSGHATKAMALALPFLFVVSNKSGAHRTLKGVVALLAIGVAFSRIVLGAHYLSDVLAGIGTAFLGLPFSMLVAHAVLRHVDESRLPKMALRWAVILVGLTVAFWFL